MLTPFSRFDWLALAMTLGLFIAGVVFIFGIGQKNPQMETYWQRQLLFGGLGLGVFLVVARIDYRWWGKYSWALYGLALALLGLVLVAGVTINTSKSWLVLPGISSFRLQPAELAKPAVLLFLSWLATRPNLREWLVYPLAGLAVGVPLLLVIAQPDWGTAMVFVPTALVVIFLRGLSWRIIVGLAVVAILLAPILYDSMPDYRKDRIRTFLQMSKAGDNEETSRAAYTVGQSRLAIGSGGLQGKGFMNGTLHILGHVPRTVAPSDLIFSVIGEETGFAGSIVLLGAFALLLLRCLWVARQADDDLGACLAAGVAALLFVHIYINIGMNIGAAPVIGIPLPLVSYGGSSVIGFFICLGLVQSVHIHRRRLA
jgi:rod shape determining protein RodA